MRKLVSHITACNKLGKCINIYILILFETFVIKTQRTSHFKQLLYKYWQKLGQIDGKMGIKNIIIFINAIIFYPEKIIMSLNICPLLRYNHCGLDITKKSVGHHAR